MALITNPSTPHPFFCSRQQEAAKESLIYVYKNAAMGFSAKLTPEQVLEIQKQPWVLQVVASQNFKCINQ
ncbi:Subtilisin-like protease SBT3.17 [Bienertia sinuspersici]